MGPLDRERDDALAARSVAHGGTLLEDRGEAEIGQHSAIVAASRRARRAQGSGIRSIVFRQAVRSGQLPHNAQASGRPAPSTR